MKEVWMKEGPLQRHLHCPVCRSRIDGVTAVDDNPISNPQTQPKPGARTICAYCASLLVFVESFASYCPVSLRVATKQEEQQAHQDPFMRLIWDSAREVAQKRQKFRGRG